METVAAIDIGSNSVRLLISGGGREQQFLETTRLGQGADQRRLAQEPIRRTVAAVSAFCARALEAGAAQVYAFATSAVRDAVNKEALLDAVYARCGLRIDVVPGEVEAHLAYLGAAAGRRALVLDIGGASTELVAGEGDAARAVSLRVGAVRLKDRFGQDRAAAAAFLDEQFPAQREAFAGYAGAACLGVGGTVTTLAAMEQALAVYDPKMVDGYALSLDAVRAWVDRLWDLPVGARAFPGLQASRADIIAHGALILERLLAGLGRETVCASTGDNLRGYLLSKRGAGAAQV